MQKSYNKIQLNAILALILFFKYIVYFGVLTYLLLFKKYFHA